jgi:hypothetical protein
MPHTDASRSPDLDPSRGEEAAQSLISRFKVHLGPSRGEEAFEYSLRPQRRLTCAPFTLCADPS